MGTSASAISQNNSEHLWIPASITSTIPGTPTIFISSLNNAIEAQSYMISLHASTIQQQQQIYQKRKIPFPNLVGVYNSSHQQNRINCMVETTFHVITERINYRMSFLPKATLSCQQAMYILSNVLNGYRTIHGSQNICYISDNMIGIKKDGSIKVWINQNWANNFPTRKTHSQHLMIDQIINIIQSYIRNKDGFGTAFTIKKQQLSPLNFHKIQQLLMLCHFNSDNAKLSLISRFKNYDLNKMNQETKQNQYSSEGWKHEREMTKKSSLFFNNKQKTQKQNSEQSYCSSNIIRKIEKKPQIHHSMNKNYNIFLDKPNNYYNHRNQALAIHPQKNQNHSKFYKAPDLHSKISINTTKHSKFAISFKNYQEQPNNQYRIPLSTRFNNFNNNYNKIDTSQVNYTHRPAKEHQNNQKLMFTKKKTNDNINAPIQFENNNLFFQKSSNENIKSEQSKTKNHIHKQAIDISIQNQIQNKNKIIQANQIGQMVHNDKQMRNISPSFTQDSFRSSKSSEDHKVALDNFKYYLFSYQGQLNAKKGSKQDQGLNQITREDLIEEQMEDERDQFILDTIQQASDDQSQRSMRHASSL